jgi:hypothetical protein
MSSNIRPTVKMMPPAVDEVAVLPKEALRVPPSRMV